MKYVTFHWLKIKNFLSVGEDPVTIKFNQGLHIITGINRDKEDRRNGVGKSTLADALYFAIFGNTLREIKKEFIANNLTNGNCVVELAFNVNSSRGNDDFIITRSLNPSKLSITKNGLDKTRDSIANTNEYIEAVLSSSAEIFQNCVIMTVNNTSPFMSKGKVEKRKFIEQIFNLQIFSQMLSNIREDHNKISKTLDIESTKFEEIDRSVKLLQNQKTSKVKEQQYKIEESNKTISSNNALIEKLKKDLDEVVDIDTASKQKDIDDTSKAIDKIAEKLEKLVIKGTEYASSIKHNKSKLETAGTDQDICPTCFRPLNEHDKAHVEQEKNNLQTCITGDTKVLNETKEEIVSLKEKQTKLKTYLVDLNRELNNLKLKIENTKLVQTRIDSLVELNDTLLKSVDGYLVDVTAFDNLINESVIRLDACKSEIENIKRSLNLIEVVKFVVSEEGVKSYIVKKILQNFNSKLAHYLKKLDSNSICIFNEYFEEEILNEKGKICSYNNFSGAERKAIDLACLFSFMDMRKYQGDVHYNISIYDELLDSSLDEKGVDLVLNILKERSDKFKECVLIISHRKESVKSATGDIIFLEKKNGITRRVNYVE